MNIFFVCIFLSSVYSITLVERSNGVSLQSTSKILCKYNQSAILEIHSKYRDDCEKQPISFSAKVEEHRLNSRNILFRIRGGSTKTDIKDKSSESIRSQIIVLNNNTILNDNVSNKNDTQNRKKIISYFSQVDEKNKVVLNYYGLMLAGAVARSVSATAVHPLNVMKTMLQTKDGKMPAMKWSVLSRGAGSQFIMSVPHGAVNFAVTETTKKELARLSIKLKWMQVIPQKILNPLLDFLSSAISTFICSVISTPQMVLTDRIMAGVYSNFFTAVYAIAVNEGIGGFYLGWLPALVQKIPSYALTWMFFQQLKQLFLYIMERPGTTIENTFIGSFAAAGACCVMIPIDTIKTRIVTQRPGTEQHYSGMVDCMEKILRNEGIGSFYKALGPRLLSVVPMIGIQFGMYELMKRLLIGAPPPKKAKMDLNKQNIKLNQNDSTLINNLKTKSSTFN
eukprot:gene12968-17389_t